MTSRKGTLVCMHNEFKSNTVSKAAVLVLIVGGTYEAFH
jgi:hypothetical protein